jgi:hypothetical protein
LVKQKENGKEKQHAFLKEICVATLYTDKKVSFVGVVDSSGKLLVGESGESISKKKGNISPQYIKPTLFYSCLLTNGLKKWKSEFLTSEGHISGSNNGSSLHFRVLELDILKLAITPLTRRGELYLCVHIEPSASSEEVISKICEAI